MSRQDKEKRAAQQQLLTEAEEAEVKLDVKPRRLATSYLGPPGLLRMIGSGDEEHIITRVVPGTDPMQDFEDDDPTQTIVIDHDTDASSDVDDLCEVSMTSAWWHRKTGVPGALIGHCGTAPANGSLSRCPSLEGGGHVGGTS